MKIARMENGYVRSDIIQDEQSYVAIYQDFSLALIDYINEQTPYESHLVYKKFFESPGVFDGLINVLVQELRRSPIRPHLCDKKARKHVIDQIVHAMMDKCNEHNLIVHDFKEIFEKLTLIKVDLDKTNLSGGYQELQEKDQIKYKMYL